MLKETFKLFHVADLLPWMKESPFETGCHSSQRLFSDGDSSFVFEHSKRFWFCSLCSRNSTEHQRTLLMFPRDFLYPISVWTLWTTAMISTWEYCNVFRVFLGHCAALVNTNRLYDMILYLQCGFNALSFCFIVHRWDSQNISKRTTFI